MPALIAPPTAAPSAPMRIVPVIAPAGTTRLPLLVVLGYVVVTFALFLLFPINWPIYRAADWVRLIAYVCVCFAVLGAMTMVGSGGSTHATAPLPYLPLLLIAGAGTAVALLVWSSVAYTGRAPWEVLDALADQGGAYKQFQQTLLATSGQRNTIVALRTLTAPLTFAVLPLGIVHWRTIGWSGRVAVVVTVLASVDFSILRGTDKEIADLLVIGAAAGCVSFGRRRMLGEPGSQLFRRYWRPVLIAVACIYIAQGLFTERKDERLGGYTSRTAVCANNSRICADLDNPWISWLPLRQRFGATFFILSTCSGYFGLELAMEKPFVTSYGVGHSPAALSVYEALTGDPTLHQRTFTWRGGEDGWPEEYYWSTLITWIANDVGFPGAVIVLGVIGYLWGRWWREAAAGMSDPATVLFAQGTMLIFYLPANNQVFASYEGYSIFFGWLAVWLWHRLGFALSAGIAAA